MSLDYTTGCVNFRDVGQYINLIAGVPLIPLNRILRGGKTDYVHDADDIGAPGTIINLRRSKDHSLFGAAGYYFPIDNSVEVYDTRLDNVRHWLNDVVETFETRALAYPVLIHCTSGKDRTGVVVAALLRILGMSDAIIVEEYLLSAGEVHEEYIRKALNGIGDPAVYFRRISLETVRRNIRGDA
jgi:protein-tyrosine phosphatase